MLPLVAGYPSFFHKFSLLFTIPVHGTLYTEDSDSYVRINGEIVCNEKWDEDYCLKVKANLCNEDDDVVHIDYDYDVKRFIKLGYETFSISCYKGNVKSIKCVEIYPKLIMTSEREDD